MVVLVAEETTGEAGTHRATLNLSTGGRIPGDIAHDLLALVTVIRGYSELLATEPSRAVQQEYCRIAVRSCDKMVRLVNDSREPGKVGDSGPALSKKLVPLAPFLRNCLSTQVVKARNKGMFLRLEVDESSTVRFDPVCVERVVDNLLDNAIKFSRQGSTITLTGRVLPESMEIDVHDDGQGIPPEDFPLLVEAFAKGTPGPTGGETSTGLGLSIVKTLVHAHHGELRLQSEVGLGSTFSVRLPLDFAAQAAAVG
jgi:signal transduction histidine kinase